MSSYHDLFCWQHQPMFDLLGPEAETQGQEEQGRTSFISKPWVPGTTMQPQRISQTKPPAWSRLPGPGTTHLVVPAPPLQQIRFCRDNALGNTNVYLCPLHLDSVVVVLITFPLLSLIHSSLLGFSSDRLGRHPALFPWGGVTAWCLRHQVTNHWLRQNIGLQRLSSVKK